MSIQFGSAPPAPAVDDLRGQCELRSRIIPRRVFASDARVIVRGRMVQETTRLWEGYTFFRHGQRLSAEEALELLGERGLTSEYRAVHQRRSRHARRLYRAAVPLLVAGAIATGTGSATMVTEALSDRRTRESAAVTGLGVVALAIGGYLAMRSGQQRRLGDLEREFFVSPRLEPGLLAAIRRYNRAHLSACPAGPPSPEGPEDDEARVPPRKRPVPEARALVLYERLPPRRVAAVMRDAVVPVRACAAAAARTGELEVKIRVSGSNGRVIAAGVRGEPRDGVLSRCVARAMFALEFPRFHEAEQTASYTFELGAPEPARPLPSPAPPADGTPRPPAGDGLPR
jgi:hypothetical protein